MFKPNLEVNQVFRNSSVRRPKSAKPYSGLLNLPIHQSEWPTKAEQFWNNCNSILIIPEKRYSGLLNPPIQMAYKCQRSFRKLVNLPIDGSPVETCY